MTKSEALKLRQNPKVLAFLAMIGESEGADYRTLVHHGRKNSVITDLSRHPNILVKSANGKAIKQSLWSTAAGKYQFLYKTWLRFAKLLGLTDFSPLSQDLAAIAQLNEVGAIPYILKNDIETAISKSRKIWASFPGAGYGQGENSLSKLLKFYNNAVGSVGEFISDNPGAAGSLSIGVIALIGLGIFFLVKD